MSDRQKELVYTWERTHISIHDKNVVQFENIQGIVNWIWAEEGLSFPPRVELIAKQNHSLATGSRLVMRFKETTYTWIILHELAHAMTSNIDDESNLHGSLFLGIYMQLVSRYMKIPISQLAESAIGLQFKLDARPVFL